MDVAPEFKVKVLTLDAFFNMTEPVFNDDVPRVREEAAVKDSEANDGVAALPKAWLALL